MIPSADIRGQVAVVMEVQARWVAPSRAPTTPLCSGSQHDCRPELQNGELIVNYG